jgi:integrase
LESRKLQDLKVSRIALLVTLELIPKGTVMPSTKSSPARNTSEVDSVAAATQQTSSSRSALDEISRSALSIRKNRSSVKLELATNVDSMALYGIPESRRPLTSYLSNRNGTKLSKSMLENLARRCTALVIEAEIVPGNWPSDPEYFPWHCLDLQQIELIKDLITSRYPNAATANSHFCYMRMMLKLSAKIQLLPKDNLHDYLDIFRLRKQTGSPAGRCLTHNEISRLIAKAYEHKSKYLAKRNSTILAVFVSTGARVGEICALRLEDWNQDEGTLFLQRTKNGKSHTLYLHPTATEFLYEWTKVRGREPGALFCHSSQGKAKVQIHLATRDIMRMLEKTAQLAGVKPTTTHDFRRTLATNLLRSQDISTVSRILNHSSITSTAAYDRAGDELARNAVNSLSLPSVADSTDGDSRGARK